MALGTATYAPAPRRPAPSVLTLLEAARGELAEARTANTPAARYAAAHLAGLRAAAAVLAARARPGEPAGRRRPRSVWELLPQMAPALSEWASFFAAGAGKRAAAEAGLPHSVTVREADDLLRDAETFLGLVEATLGPLRIDETRAQKDSTARRASGSNTPQPMSSSVKTPGDLS